MQTSEFYLTRELADRLRVSKMTVYRYIKTGKIAAHKIGKEYRITKAEYERFIRQTRTK